MKMKTNKDRKNKPDKKEGREEKMARGPQAAGRHVRKEVKVHHLHHGQRWT